MVGADPDCDEKICAPKTIRRKVTKSIIHENWNTTGYPKRIQRSGPM